jgi:hypothetical protein
LRVCRGHRVTLVCRQEILFASYLYLLWSIITEYIRKLKEGQEKGERAGGTKQVELDEIIKHQSNYVSLLFRKIDMSLRHKVETSKDKSNQFDSNQMEQERLNDCIDFSM